MPRYEIDTTHSSIDFSIRHLVIAKVRGRFTKFRGRDRGGEHLDQ